MNSPLFAEFHAFRTFGAGVAAAVPLLVLNWVQRAAQQESIATQASRSAYFPKAMRILVVALWLFAAVFDVMLALTVKDWDARSIVSFALLFGGLTLVLHLETYVTRITWDDHHIFTNSPWRPRRVIPFAAVRSCDCSPSLRWFRIHTEGYGIIRLHTMLCGVSELLSALPCPVPDLPAEMRAKGR